MRYTYKKERRGIASVIALYGFPVLIIFFLLSAFLKGQFNPSPTVTAVLVLSLCGWFGFASLVAV
ncbi:hypothetical protein [Hungatella sp.]|uniref:hypothetical protein n=1 Tax=Hungatella sp. TaxID=2613924 RepID=UPI002A80B83E|nr:hypothetical protein [Hungatella sp.]